MKYKTFRGFFDYFDKYAEKYQNVIKIIESIGKKFNCDWIITPLVEQKELFCRSLGLDSDIVSKEMFEMEFSEGAGVLRPEGTASVVRSVIENDIKNKRLMYVGPMFRKERPQAGRQRQFNQFGFEFIGDNGISAEIECLLIVKQVLEKLKINYLIKINSIGSAANRKKYVETLKEFLAKNLNKLSDESKSRYEKQNYFRILDSKEDKNVIVNAPKLFDYLDQNYQQNFLAIENFLQQNNIAFERDPTLIRGLDYYNGFVFEIVAIDSKAAQNALGGGGRYDGLCEILSENKVKYSAIGMAFGIERLIMNSAIEFESNCKIAVAQLTNDYSFFTKLTDLETNCSFEITGYTVTDALKQANKKNFNFLLIIGDESRQNKFPMKHLETGKQINYSWNELEDIVKNKEK